ncbi:transposase [Actinoplanes oblitus]|uniref:Transposase n=1 Tax=Actinoplanes oblitus TaxID=3040509 RepID=A0ABY8WQH1_9ACTN|nr:transposase [Actinoplanes oblitus]
MNDEAELLELISDVLAISQDVLWAVDVNHGGAALLIGLLLGGDQPMVYLTGLAVHRASAAIRRSGAKRIETWLKNRNVKGAAAVAEAVVATAQAQHTALPGEALAAAMVARLAAAVMTLDEEIGDVDALIDARFHEHPHAEVIRSLPGTGPLLGATFITVTGGDVKAFGTADRLAAFAGLSPVPRDSGRISGNMRRPRRYHRGLLRAFYLSAMASLRSCPSHATTTNASAQKARDTSKPCCPSLAAEPTSYGH